MKAALLAREAHQFNIESNGEFINEVYDALRRTLNAVDNDRGGPDIVGPSHRDWVRTVAHSPSGQWVASAGNDGNVYLWSQQRTPGDAIILPAHRRNAIRDLRFNPAGNLMATVGDDRRLRIWESSQDGFEEIHEFTLSNGLVRGLAFRPEGDYIALASEGDAINILPARGDVSRPPFKVATSGMVIRSVSFTSDGQWLIGGDTSGNLHVWSWNNLGGSPETIRGHRGAVRAISINGPHIITGGEDAMAVRWSLDNQGQLIPQAFLRGHSGPVNSVAFSKDGSRLATGSGDQTVRLWRLGQEETQAPVVLRDHSSWVESVSFGMDGKTLITGSADRTVRIWRIDPSELAKEICDAVKVSLSPEEWIRYAGDHIEYPNSCAPNPAINVTADKDTPDNN